MTTDTTFEHVLYNINEKNNIIMDIYNIINVIKTKIPKNDPTIIYLNRIDSEFNNYMENISKFNIEVVEFISEYYNINDDYKDAFNNKLIYTYSSHKNHYSPLESGAYKFFNIKELVDIFVEHCYEFKTFTLYTNFTSFKDTKILEKNIYNKLNDYILSENIYESINNIIYEFKLFIKAITNIINDENLVNINKLLNKFNSINLEMKTNELVFDLCECGNKMNIHSCSSEMVCEKCGYSYMLEGTVLEDTMFYSQADARYKHANYQPAKHCRSWLERIQAKESNNISKEHINKIEMCIKRDNIKNKKAIPISQFRRYLKDCNLSELNEHIALIRKIITGIIPPTLSYSETQLIINSFSKSVKAYNVIKPNTKSNMIFYPYLLRKLIEMHIKDYHKKKELLSFIHLQGSQTLSQNDKIWYEVCKIVPEFHYMPTDRYKYLE